MRFKWVLILMTVMFIIGFCGKRHTNHEYVKTNTVVIVDTVQVDSMRNNTTIIPIEIIDTLQTNM